MQKINDKTGIQWNMRLHTVWMGMTQTKREAFCEKIGTSMGHVPQIMYGHKPTRITLAINMDKETKGEIPMWESRPDVDWDYVLKALKRRERILKHGQQQVAVQADS